MKKSTIRYKKIKRAITTSFKRLSVAVKTFAEGIKNWNIAIIDLNGAMKTLTKAIPPLPLNKREQAIVDKYTLQYTFSPRMVAITYLLYNKKTIFLRKALRIATKLHKEPNDGLIMEILRWPR